MRKTAVVRARVEPDLKERAESVFARVGLGPTQAITLFYKQVELRDGLPFDVVVPKPTTRRAFEDSEAGCDLVICEDANGMFQKLLVSDVHPRMHEAVREGYQAVCPTRQEYGEI